MKQLLEAYCREKHPEIRKVSSISTGMMKFLEILSNKRKMKTTAAMFSYFEKGKEPVHGEEADKLPGKAETTFRKWIAE